MFGMFADNSESSGLLTPQQAMWMQVADNIGRAFSWEGPSGSPLQAYASAMERNSLLDYRKLQADEIREGLLGKQQKRLEESRKLRAQKELETKLASGQMPTPFEFIRAGVDPKWFATTPYQEQSIGLQSRYANAAEQNAQSAAMNANTNAANAAAARAEQQRQLHARQQFGQALSGLMEPQVSGLLPPPEGQMPAAAGQMLQMQQAGMPSLFGMGMQQVPNVQANPWASAISAGVEAGADERILRGLLSQGFGGSFASSGGGYNMQPKMFQNRVTREIVKGVFNPQDPAGQYYYAQVNGQLAPVSALGGDWTEVTAATAAAQDKTQQERVTERNSDRIVASKTLGAITDLYNTVEAKDIGAAASLGSLVDRVSTAVGGLGQVLGVTGDVKDYIVEHSDVSKDYLSQWLEGIGATNSKAIMLGYQIAKQNNQNDRVSNDDFDKGMRTIGFKIDKNGNVGTVGLDEMRGALRSQQQTVLKNYAIDEAALESRPIDELAVRDHALRQLRPILQNSENWVTAEQAQAELLPYGFQLQRIPGSVPEQFVVMSPWGDKLAPVVQAGKIQFSR